ncbi:hypothetical protein ACFC01_49075 [Streptomyces mirabilis]|uniref:hypothetical protein n=1 Tax=Streptomyces TaxID=1883 RepID=UPI0015CF7DC1|nr:hypothetical protein [Streptomyces sp. OK228]
MYLNGPPIDKKPKPGGGGSTRRLARQLLKTAGDELVRTAVKASTTGLGLLAWYWIQHR